MKFKTSKRQSLIAKLPKEVVKLFKIFEGSIRLVGGCVRDLILERQIHDYDFATKALPDDIIKILKKNNIQAIPTGIKFGTITAVINGNNFEITTLRKDQNQDGRHCDVEFVDDYFFDAARRDFTMNALYLDEKGVIYDYFGGIADIKSKKVKFIGDAQERIKEDFLRILRFFRFNVKYAKLIDDVGLQACIKYKAQLKTLSVERIRQEFLKLLAADNKKNLVKILKILKTQEIASEIFTEKLNLIALKRVFLIEEEIDFKASLQLRMAALFLKDSTLLEDFFEEIHATNKEKKYFYLLSDFLHRQILNRRFAKFPELIEEKNLKLLLLSNESDWVFDCYLINLCRNFNHDKLPKVAGRKKYFDEFSLPKFPLSGQDFIDLGFSGKAIGEEMERAKEFWVDSDFKAMRNEILSFIKG